MGHRWVTCRIISLWTSVPDHIYLKQSVLYTYTATRPLRALYFDGFSAAKTPEGTLDSQDILLYGEVEDWRHPHDDYDRGVSLCEWGKEFGIEGFVREEATFEVRCYHRRHFFSFCSPSLFIMCAAALVRFSNRCPAIGYYKHYPIVLVFIFTRPLTISRYPCMHPPSRTRQTKLARPPQLSTMPPFLIPTGNDNTLLRTKNVVLLPRSIMARPCPRTTNHATPSILRHAVRPFLHFLSC
jgi:hypothetical protein